MRTDEGNFALNKDIFCRNLNKIDWITGECSLPDRIPYFLSFVLESRNSCLRLRAMIRSTLAICAKRRNAGCENDGENDVEHVTRPLTNRYVRRAVSVS